MCGCEVDGGAVVRLALTRRNCHRPWLRKIERWMCVQCQAGNERFAEFCIILVGKLRHTIGNTYSAEAPCGRHPFAGWMVRRREPAVDTQDAKRRFGAQRDRWDAGCHFADVIRIVAAEP